MASLLPRLEYVNICGGENGARGIFGGWRKGVDVFKNVLGVEKFWIDVLGREEIGANNKDFGGDGSKCDGIYTIEIFER